MEAGEVTLSGNRVLSTPEVRALSADDFLLGRSVPKAVPRRLRDWATVDEAVALVDDALRHGDLGGAEALWRHVATVALPSQQLPNGGAATAVSAALPLDAAPAASSTGHPGTFSDDHGMCSQLVVSKHMASRVATVLAAASMDELEAALDRGDRFAARREHQRLFDNQAASSRLAGTCAAAAVPEDVRRRQAELEARYRQFCGADNSALVCSLFPDIWCFLCWDRSRQEAVHPGPPSRAYRLT